MAQWAKNQIAKHLAKFVKNLDPNSLSLKFFKGEGELTNLELEEGLISDLLEFPPWLQLSKVTCNRISAKVPWTSLKSDPLRLILDTVDVQIVASEELRAKSSSPVVLNNKNSSTKPNKYGFAEKVVDGMYVSINTLTASFTSIGFKATVNISRIIVQSTTPEWRAANNLRQTRIKDEDKGEVINFKEIRWGTMRVHADASYKAESNDIPSTPLRLITNSSIIRLIIKKRLADCSMVASKLAVILDDILWVLTRSQIIKLSSFVHYIIKLRNKHLPITQQTAAKQEEGPAKSSSVSSQDQLFNAYDLKESSLHLRTQRVDLHLCDDSSLNGNQSKKKREEYASIYDEPGAALQISLLNIGLDHYPYHVVGTKRISSKSDDEMAFQRSRWAHQLLNNFQETEGKQWKKPRNTSATVESRSKRPPRMYESYFVVRCEDYVIMQVTTPNTHNPQPFLKSEKESLYLPKEMSAVQIDYTIYYYTKDTDLSVPSPNVFVQVNPFQLTFDALTCVWLNRFTQSVAAGLDWTREFIVRESGFTDHVNVRIEAVMPKILIPLNKGSTGEKKEQHHSDERPQGLQLLISQTIVSNCRVGEKCAQADILNDLQSFVSSRQYADMSCYPNEKHDLAPNSNATWLNDYSINCLQLQNLTRHDKALYSRLKRDGSLPHQIWGLCCDQVWMEFVGVEKALGRPVTFVDAFPLRLWICQKVPYVICDERSISPFSMASSVESAESINESDGGDYQSSVIQPHRAMSVHSPPTIIHIPSGDGNPQLRNSHSDSDLIDAPRTSSFSYSQHPRHATSSTAIAGSENYAWGGPPPPYGGARNIIVESVRNSPPTYDSITQHDDTTDPGPIMKPPIEDCANLDVTVTNTDATDNDRTASTALLVNIEKTVQVQLEHFQMLALLRLGEDIGSMTERIELDNKKQGEEEVQQQERDPIATTTGPLDKESGEEESVVLNISVPHVLIDLVLAPCIGIDPIQRLSLQERVEHEIQQKKLKKSIHHSHQQEPKTAGGVASSSVGGDGDALNVLPMRSRRKSLTVQDSRSQSLTGSPNLSENCKVAAAGVLSEPLSSSTDVEPHHPVQRRNSSSSSFTGSCNNISSGQHQHDQAASSGIINKDIKDAQVQAGDPLVDANLRPSGENQLISVLRIHAESVKVGIESRDGNNAVVKVTSSQLKLNELGNMKYGQVLDPRGCIIEDKEHTQEKQGIVNMSSLTGDAMVKLRMTAGPNAEQFAKGGKEFGFADIRVKSLAAALLMSTVDNLTEFGEDEFVLPTMPFRVRVSGSDISLYDDKPRKSRSAIKLPPSHVVISDLVVERDSSGVVTLNPCARETSQRQSDEFCGEVVVNNEDALSSLSSAATTNAQALRDEDSIVIHRQVDALIGENGRLVEDLKLVNAKVNGLHTERESLLKVIDNLQKEMMMSNRENDELQKRMRNFSISSANHSRRPNQS